MATNNNYRGRTPLRIAVGLLMLVLMMCDGAGASYLHDENISNRDNETNIIENYFGRINFTQTQFDSEISLDNPSIFPIWLNRIEYSIFIGDIKVGSGKSEENVVLLPYSAKNISFESEIDNIAFVNSLPYLENETSVDIKGNIVVNFGFFKYNYPMSISQLWGKSIMDRLAFAYPASDLTGDNASEIILNTWNLTGKGSTDIYILNGNDGSNLWSKNSINGLAVAYPASDLTEDNVSEIIIANWNVTTEPGSTDIYVLNGKDGSSLWSKNSIKGLAAAYPASDLTGDNASEIILNTWNLTQPGSTDIYVLNGKDGSSLWSKSITNRLAIAYPATDLTGDNASEIILNTWNLTQSGSTDIYVLNGKDGSSLWSKSITNGLAVAYPATDLTGDNASEIILNTWNLTQSGSTDIYVLNGKDGSSLWSKSITNRLAVAYPATDLTGDNSSEIIIANWNLTAEPGSTDIHILNGKDGSNLWSKNGIKGLAAAYPATDLTGDNSSEIIIDTWNLTQPGSTDIYVLNGKDGSSLWSKNSIKGLAAAYPATDLTGGNSSEIIITTLNLDKLSTTISIVSISPNTDPVTNGDANGDGQVTIVDALFVAQHTVGTRTLTSTQIAAADVNGDGQVTIVDALFIAQYTVGLRQL